MFRCFLTLLCAFSVAAMAVAQDDDLDALLAGLGDEDAFSDAPAEAAPAEADPFADLFEAEAAEAEAAAQEAVQDAADDFAEVADDFAEAADGFAEVADEIPQEAPSAEAEDDLFSDFFEEAPAEEVAEEVAEATEGFAETADDFTDAATEAADDFADFAADAAEDIPVAAEAEVAEAFVDDSFDEFFDDVPAEEPSPATETADLPESIPEAPQAAAPITPIAPDFPAEEPAEDFDALFASSGSFPEEAAPEGDAETQEVAPADNDATLAEAKAAAVLIRENKKQSSDKPAKGKKKDKFSSAARKPIKSGASEPDWNEPVALDTSATPAPAPATEAKPSPKPSSSSNADWNQPVLW